MEEGRESCLPSLPDQLLDQQPRKEAKLAPDIVGMIAIYLGEQ